MVVHRRALTRRRTVEQELERLKNLYRWGDLPEAEFLSGRQRITRELEQLVEVAVSEPSADALKLAAEIGRAWSLAGEDVRRRFVHEWFAEIRLHRDGQIDVLPREPYREIVAAATEGAHGGRPRARTEDLLLVREAL